MTRRDTWTVREYAQLERVNERTVRRWIAKGAVVIRRTPGGGVRIMHPPVGQPMTHAGNRGQSTN